MNIVSLAGGVGGAKLSAGLADILSPNELTIIVNTGDDFRHLGLNISPDLDTVCYTLAGLENAQTGWGRVDDTYNILNDIKLLGGPSWFRIGDKDLATHVERTRRLLEGQTLTTITRAFCQAWGLRVTILPMSDEPVHTYVDTAEYGELPFQEYFVYHQCKPTVIGFRFDGIEKANPAPGIFDAVDLADAVIICPSNPWVSIDPILSLPGFRQKIRRKPIIAVTPIIGGKTIKGPAAKMFTELGIEPSALSVAYHYQEILTGFVFDSKDSELTEKMSLLSMKTYSTDTVMKTSVERRLLAKDVLNFIHTL